MQVEPPKKSGWPKVFYLSGFGQLPGHISFISQLTLSSSRSSPPPHRASSSSTPRRGRHGAGVTTETPGLLRAVKSALELRKSPVLRPIPRGEGRDGVGREEVGG